MKTSPKNPKARILIIDDQATNIQLVHNLLKTDYDVYMATSAKQALENYSKIKPDLILLDVRMPVMDGLTLCKKLKKNPDSKDIPVIFITAQQSSEEEEQCWQAGGSDFISKPINPITLKNRIHAQLKIQFQAESLKKLSFIDGLTGIPNRRCFDTEIEKDFLESKRNQQELTLMMIDIDFFKHYNDHYGHLAGDDCLRKIATALHHETQRAGDLMARYGGEEFVCILKSTDKKGSLQFANKLIQTIQKLNIKHEDSELAPQVTISIGVATYPCQSIQDVKDLIQKADKNLYQAKNNGRNQVAYSD